MELWLIILLSAAALGALGAGGYYGYKYYQSTKTDKSIQSAMSQAETVERAAIMSLDTEPRTIWTDHWIVFVKWAQVPAANGMFKNIDPDVGGDKTFGNVRLSPSGNEPPTYSGCNTRATGPMSAGIFEALGNVPWAEIYDGHQWSWEDALADAGLQVIEPEEEL